MTDRIEVHNELLQFCSNVYFQVPSGMQMKYPCIKYTKAPNSKQFGNNGAYLKWDVYDITVIDKNPDGVIADELESYFHNCTIGQRYVVDGLNHTALKLYI